MTIAKLNKEHTSNPVNPVLAHPVYLSGYIEQMGTGTTDIIDHCLDYGLRKPEFHQDDDFRVVLWRPEVQERVQECTVLCLYFPHLLFMSEKRS